MGFLFLCMASHLQLLVVCLSRQEHELKLKGNNVSFVPLGQCQMNCFTGFKVIL